MTPDRPLLDPLTTTMDEQMFEDCYNHEQDFDYDCWLEDRGEGGWVITRKSTYEYNGYEMGTII